MEKSLCFDKKTFILADLNPKLLDDRLEGSLSSFSGEVASTEFQILDNRPSICQGIKIAFLLRVYLQTTIISVEERSGDSHPFFDRADMRSLFQLAPVFVNLRAYCFNHSGNLIWKFGRLSTLQKSPKATK